MITVCPSCEEDGLFFPFAGIDGVHVKCAACGEGFYLLPETMTLPQTDAFQMTFDEPTAFDTNPEVW